MPVISLHPDILFLKSPNAFSWLFPFFPFSPFLKNHPPSQPTRALHKQLTPPSPARPQAQQLTSSLSSTAPVSKPQLPAPFRFLRLLVTTGAAEASPSTCTSWVTALRFRLGVDVGTGTAASDLGSRRLGVEVGTGIAGTETAASALGLRTREVGVGTGLAASALGFRRLGVDVAAFPFLAFGPAVFFGGSTLPAPAATTLALRSPVQSSVRSNAPTYANSPVTSSRRGSRFLPPRAPNAGSRNSSASVSTIDTVLSRLACAHVAVQR